MKEAAGFAGAGAVAAFTGSLVGLGGGFVLIPLLTGVGRFSQHMASGTSLAVVVATGLSGLLTFGGADAIDLPGAGFIAGAGMLSGYFGATATTALSGATLGLMMSGFMVLIAPVVAFKSEITAFLKQQGATDAADDAADAADGTNDLASGAVRAGSKTFADALTRPASEIATLLGLGAVVGYMSGLFGVGGGSIMTPGLCLLTGMTHYEALGTSLAAMILPSLSALRTHHVHGNVAVQALVPLVGGALVGGVVGGKLALDLPERELQMLFGVVVGLLGARGLIKALSKRR